MIFFKKNMDPTAFLLSGANVVAVVGNQHVVLSHHRLSRPRVVNGQQKVPAQAPERFHLSMFPAIFPASRLMLRAFEWRKCFFDSQIIFNIIKSRVLSSHRCRDRREVRHDRWFVFFAVNFIHGKLF